MSKPVLAPALVTLLVCPSFLNCGRKPSNIGARQSGHRGLSNAPVERQTPQDRDEWQGSRSIRQKCLERVLQIGFMSVHVSEMHEPSMAASRATQRQHDEQIYDQDWRLEWICLAHVARMPYQVSTWQQSRSRGLSGYRGAESVRNRRFVIAERRQHLRMQMPSNAPEPRLTLRIFTLIPTATTPLFYPPLTYLTRTGDASESLKSKRKHEEENGGRRPVANWAIDVPLIARRSTQRLR